MLGPLLAVGLVSGAAIYANASSKPALVPSQSKPPVQSQPQAPGRKSRPGLGGLLQDLWDEAPSILPEALKAGALGAGAGTAAGSATGTATGGVIGLAGFLGGGVAEIATVPGFALVGGLIGGGVGGVAGGVSGAAIGGAWKATPQVQAWMAEEGIRLPGQS